VLMCIPAQKLEAEAFAEIEAAHVGIVDDFLRSSLGQDLTLMDDEGAVDELERLSDIVIRNKHPDSPSGKLSHQLAYITDRNRINSREWLVEEHESRMGGEGAGDFHPATLTARQRHSWRMS
jgi:hypothetical protein